MVSLEKKLFTVVDHSFLRIVNLIIIFTVKRKQRRIATYLTSKRPQVNFFQQKYPTVELMTEIQY